MKEFLTDEQIGARLKAARLAKGLSQTELANKIGVGQTAVGKWENGVVKNIKRSMLQQIAQVLEISPLIIIGIVPNEGKKITVTPKDIGEELFSLVQDISNKKTSPEDYLIIQKKNHTEEQYKQIKNFVDFIKGAKQ